MINLDFSLISTVSADKIIRDFEWQTDHTVSIQQSGWDNAWNETIRAAIYRSPMDVSEVGSSWISDLRAMGVLHPFSEPEIESLGGEKAYLPASWNNCISPDDCRVWSIPWTVDTRFVFYRRDWLEKAGIDPTTAFGSDAAFKNALQTLKEQGIPYPLAIPTRRTRMILHNAATWVWGAGGDFLTSDGKATLFTSPESLDGFYKYFDLARFLTPETCQLDGEQSDAFFSKGKAAMAISGPWLLYHGNPAPEERANIGFTFLPGVPFVGGSNLILWQQSNDPKAALALIRFLTSPEFQSTYFVNSGYNSGYLPSRLEVLSSPLFSQDPRYHSLEVRLNEGRSFKPLHLWGMVEERLTTVIRQTWDEIFNTPNTDYRIIVERNLKTAAHRLNLTLGQPT